MSKELPWTTRRREDQQSECWGCLENRFMDCLDFDSLETELECDNCHWHADCHIVNEHIGTQKLFNLSQYTS